MLRNIFSSRRFPLHPIFFITDHTDVILAPVHGQRAAFAGRQILVGICRNLIAALFAFVGSLGCRHMVSIIPEGELNSDFLYNDFGFLGFRMPV